MRKKNLQKILLAIGMILPLASCSSNDEPVIIVPKDNTSSSVDNPPDDPLERAKYYAHKDVDSVLLKDYRTAEVNLLIPLKRDTHTQIDNCSTESEVNAVLADFWTKVNQYKTDAQYKEYEKLHLDEEKEKAKKKIEDMIDLSLYYSDEQNQILQQQKVSNTEIFKATTTQEIETAVKDFETLMKNIKTKAQHDEENDASNLLAMKSKYTKLVDEYNNTLTFSDENLEKLNNCKKSYKNLINSANSKDAIVDAYNAFIKEASVIYSLQDGKVAAAVSNAESSVKKYNPLNYREPEKTTVAAAWSILNGFVYGTNSVQCINDAVTDFLKKVKGLKTDVEYYKDELKEEKRKAIEKINSTPNKNDYRQAEQAQLIAIRNKYIALIESQQDLVPSETLSVEDQRKLIEDHRDDIANFFASFNADYTNEWSVLKTDQQYRTQENSDLTTLKVNVIKDIQDYRDTDIATLHDDVGYNYKTQAINLKNDSYTNINNVTMGNYLDCVNTINNIQTKVKTDINSLFDKDGRYQNLLDLRSTTITSITNYKTSDIAGMEADNLTSANDKLNEISSQINSTTSMPYIDGAVDDTSLRGNISTLKQEYERYIDSLLSKDVNDKNNIQLASEKQTAKDNINAYKTSDISSMLIANRVTASDYKQQAIDDIDKTTTLGRPASIESDYKSKIDALITKDSADKANQSLSEAIESAKESVNTSKQTDIDTTYNDLNSNKYFALAEDFKAAVNAAKSKYISLIENETNISTIQGLPSQYDSEIDTIISDFASKKLAKALSDAKEEAKSSKDSDIQDIEYSSLYVNESIYSAEFAQLKSDYDTKYDNATTIAVLNDLRTEYHLEAKRLITMHYLQKKLVDTIATTLPLNKYESIPNYKQNLDNLYQNAITDITNATSESTIDSAVTTFIDAATDAVTTFKELEEYKESTINGLEGVAGQQNRWDTFIYRGSSAPNLVVNAKNRADVDQAISDATDNINACKTKADVDVEKNAFIAIINSLIAQDQKAADDEAAALIKAKNDAQNLIDSHVTSDYEGWDSVNSQIIPGSDAEKISEANKALLAAKNDSSATSASVNAAIDAYNLAIAGIVTAQEKQSQTRQHLIDAANTLLASVDLSVYDGYDVTNPTSDALTIKNAKDDLATIVADSSSTADQIRAKTAILQNLINSTKTAAQKAEEAAKAAAVSSAESLIAQYTGKLTSYDSADQTTINDAITALTAAKDDPNATSTSINTAISTFNSVVSGLQTTEEKAKAKAISDASDLITEYTSKLSDYESADQTTIQTAIDTLTAAKNDATKTSAEITTAIDAFNNTVSKLQTKAEKDAAARAQAVIDADAEIAKYPTSNYSDSDLATLNNAIDALNNVKNDSTKTSAEITTAIDAFKTAVTSIKTTVEREAEAKTQAISDANNAIANYTTTNYSGDDLTTLNNAISTLQGVINDSDSTSTDIKTAITAFNNSVSTIKTTAERIQEAKENAEHILNGVDEKTYNGYTPESGTVDGGDYQAESYAQDSDAAKVKAAKETLQAVLNNTNSTLEQITQALQAFQTEVANYTPTTPAP